MRCELAVPPGGSMPIEVAFRIIDDRKREHGGTNLSPTELIEGRYRFEGSIQLPRKPGIYSGQARAIQTVKREAHEDKPDEYSTRITPSDLIPVKVQ